MAQLSTRESRIKCHNDPPNLTAGDFFIVFRAFLKRFCPENYEYNYLT